MYVTGIGRTKFGTLTETMPELIYQAMYNAINDTPISIEDIGAVYVSNFIGGPSEKQLHLNSGSKLETTEFRCNCFSDGPPIKLLTYTAPISSIEIGLSLMALYIA